MRQIILVLCLFFGSLLSAQTLEERFRAFQQSAKMEYESFRDKANEQYAEFMRKAWEYYTVGPILPQPKEEPVPPMPYDEDDKEQKEEDKEVVIEEVISTPELEPQPEPVEPIKLEPQPFVNNEKAVTFKLQST